jgi:hypothetical protein
MYKYKSTTNDEKSGKFIINLIKIKSISKVERKKLRKQRKKIINLKGKKKLKNNDSDYKPNNLKQNKKLKVYRKIQTRRELQTAKSISLKQHKEFVRMCQEAAEQRILFRTSMSEDPIRLSTFREKPGIYPTMRPSNSTPNQPRKKRRKTRTIRAINPYVAQRLREELEIQKPELFDFQKPSDEEPLHKKSISVAGSSFSDDTEKNIIGDSVLQIGPSSLAQSTSNEKEVLKLCLEPSEEKLLPLRISLSGFCDPLNQNSQKIMKDSQTSCVIVPSVQRKYCSKNSSTLKDIPYVLSDNFINPMIPEKKDTIFTKYIKKITEENLKNDCFLNSF